MKCFFDTEFIEDGKTIDLISIGIVREDGEEFYAEVRYVDWSKASQWVLENVQPYLTGPTFSKDEIARRVVEFVGPNPEFWAYYADYDWVVLCQLFGRMIDLPDGWPMFCMDIKQLCVEKGNPKLPDQTGVEHNALDDAKWNLEAYRFLINLRR